MSFKWRKIFKRLSVGVCSILAAGMLFTGCGGEDGGSSGGGDMTTLKVGVTNFADTLEPTQNYFGWVVMRYGLGECLTKFDEKMNIIPRITAKAAKLSVTATIYLRIFHHSHKKSGKPRNFQSLRKIFPS